MEFGYPARANTGKQRIVEATLKQAGVATTKDAASVTGIDLLDHHGAFGYFKFDI
jgi:hypothetical protein